MGTQVPIDIEFDRYGFSVYVKYVKVDGGYFSNGRIYFTETQSSVELFEDQLHEKVTKLIKSEKEAWNQIKNL